MAALAVLGTLANFPPPPSYFCTQRATPDGEEIKAFFIRPADAGRRALIDLRGCIACWGIAKPTLVLWTLFTYCMFVCSSISFIRLFHNEVADPDFASSISPPSPEGSFSQIVIVKKFWWNGFDNGIIQLLCHSLSILRPSIFGGDAGFKRVLFFFFSTTNAFDWCPLLHVAASSS